MSDEKRKHSRIAKKIKSEVHSEEIMTYSTTQNLSQGGIFITTPEPLQIGTQIELSLNFPDDDPIDVKGIVRWHRDEVGDDIKAGMGIEFIEIAEGKIDTIKKNISNKDE